MIIIILLILIHHKINHSSILNLKIQLNRLIIYDVVKIILIQPKA